MATTTDTQTLRDALQIFSNTYPGLILKDGGSDWSSENLMDALEDSDLDREVYVDERDLDIHKINEQGYIETVAWFTAQK